MKQTEFVKLLIFLISLFSILLLNSSNVNAGIFNVGVTVTGGCIPNWQCTALSDDTCGTRDCVDINGCGINTGKPDESIECKVSNSGSGRSDDDVSVEESLPKFELSSNVIRMNLNSGEDLKKTIRVYSKKDYSYSISISSANSRFLEMVSVSKNSLTGNDDFDIFVKTGSLTSGLYSGLIIVENDYQTEEIVVIINVLSNGPAFEIDLNNTKIIDKSTILTPIITFENNDILKNILKKNQTINITYSLIAANGEELFSFFSTNTDGSPVVLPMPATLTKGYYLLVVTVLSEDGSTTKYFTLYSDPEHTLIPYVEQAKEVNSSNNTLIYVWIIISSLLLIIFVYSGIFLSKKIFLPKKYSEIIRDVYEEQFISKEEYDEFIGKKNAPVVTVKDQNTSIDLNESKTAVDILAEKKINPAFLEKCLYGKEFVLEDGKKLYSIQELFESLEFMNDGMFYHHVNSEKNDFANWILDVFKNSNLSSSVRICKNRTELRDLLSKELFK